MPNPPLIYIETCPILDLVKIDRNLPLDYSQEEIEQRKQDVQVLKLLCDASHDGAIQLVTSVLTVAECQHAGDISDDGIPHKDTMEMLHDFLLSGRFIKLIEADVFTAERARNLRWEDRIRLSGSDSLHVATALSVGCAEFITTDKKINQKKKFNHALPRIEKLGIAIRRASDTAHLPEEYRTDDLFESKQTSSV